MSDHGRHLRGALGEPGEPPSAREFAGWLGAGLLIAVIMSWPLLLNLTGQVPQDTGDPLLEAWTVAWVGHAVKHQPWHLFGANAFWPAGSSLAFSDSLVGYAPAGMIGSGLTAAIVRYNLLFLFAYALCFAGAAFLARELRARIPAAAVAGIAFAYAPWRLAQNGHLHVLSIGGIPLALALLVGGYRRRRPSRIIAGWLVATWQMTIGFGVGVYFFYFLAAVGLVTAGVWLWRGLPPPDRRTAAATLVGAAVFGAVTLAMAMPYRHVLRDYPEARRDRLTVEFFSPPVSALLAAPVESLAWGERTREIRASMPWAPEHTLFPGLAVVLLALGGLGARRVPRGLRVGLGAGTAVCTMLSFGLRFRGGYRFLYEHLPGLDGLRTPGRLTMFTSLGLALLAAFGADRMAVGLASRVREGRYRQMGALTPSATAMAAILGAGVLIAYEGATALRRVDVPRPPSGLAGLADPRFHLPTGPFEDVRYMLWSIEGFPRIGNGYSGFDPRQFVALRRGLPTFPDAASVAMLRRTGFRIVVLHPDIARGTPWQDTATRPIDGLGITRERHGDVIVYNLDK